MLGTTNASSSQASMNNLSISINGVNKLTYNGKDARTLDISLSAIGAAAVNHTHAYLPLTGGTLTGQLNINASLKIYDCFINESGSGNLWFNGRFCSIKNQGSYNLGWFHIHDGELVKYIDNNNVFARDLLWKAPDGLVMNVSDIGTGAQWTGYRLQRYLNSPQIDVYRCTKDVYTHLGSLARMNNYNQPNEAPMYLGEQNKYINGDPGGWIHLSFNTYISGPLDVYGAVRTRGNYFFQDDSQGGIVSMQQNGPNTKMLWAW